MQSSARHGVVLTNTGSPDAPTPEAVKVYLEQFLGNPRICPMNPRVWSFILHHCILPTRSRKSAEKYKTIWTDEGFTFIADHRRLAERVDAKLRSEGESVEVVPGMSFGSPSMKAALTELAAKGCSDITVLPLFPQSAFSTTGIACDDARAWIADRAGGVSVHVIEGYSDNPLYVQAIADAVSAAGFDERNGDILMMSFHSIPLADIKAGDTYEQTTKQTCVEVARALGIARESWAFGYQSRFDKEREWLSPFTDHVFEELAQRDFPGRLFFVCPNFSVDCLETYYDISHEIKPQWLAARAAAGKPAREDEFVYVPCLNASPAQVELVCDVIERSWETEGR